MNCRRIVSFGLFCVITFLPFIAHPQVIKTFSLKPAGKSIDKQKLILPYKNFAPRVGLSLSGGGARGIAHIGVLKVLVENNIPIDFISGTSMGNIVGGLYASGYTPDQIWKLAKSINWSDIIQDQPARLSLFLSQKEVRNRHLINLRIKDFKPYIPSAISPGQKLYNQLNDLILSAPFQTTASFDDLKIPFRAVATDLISGKKIVFSDGDLAQVMLASSAIPLLFSPVKIDSMLLMDGGILENIPVSELIQAGVDLIIAVDVTSPLRKSENILLPWQLADQVTTIMQENQKSSSLKMADVVIKPRLYARTNTDFDSLDSAYLAGMKAAQDKIPEILKKMNMRRNQFFKSSDSWKVNRVDIENESLLKNFVNLSFFQENIWTEQDVYSRLEALNNSGYFSHVAAELIKRDNSQIILRFRNTLFPKINKIIFHGNVVLSDSLLCSSLKTAAGQRFNIIDWQKDREKILRLYRDHDFSKARIFKEQLDYTNGNLEISIDEGRVEYLNIIGNRKTKTAVILREYPIKPGDYFRKSLAQQGSNNIFSLDFFDRVQPEYKWKDENLAININVVEKPTQLLRFSYNFNRDDRFTTQLQFVDNNLFGYGSRLISSAVLGKRRYAGSLRLQTDRIFQTYLTPTIDFYYDKRKHYVYDRGDIKGEFQERRSGFFASIGHQIKRVGLVSVRFRLEQVGLNPVFGYGYPISRVNRSSIKLLSIVDSLDKLPFPTQGRYHNFYYEMSNEFGGSQLQFFKIYSSLESYYTFFKRWTIHPKLVWATADLTTPFQEMFILGGENSFLGYRTDEIRGRRLFQTALEVRYFLPGKFPFDTYFSLRYDYGKMWANSLDVINFKDFIQGYGGTIAFNSILGVFSFSYGENNFGRKEYYFNLGFDF